MMKKMISFVVLAIFSTLIQALESRAQSWTNLGSGINGNANIKTLTCDSHGNLYAGGEFTTAGGMSAN